MSLFLKYRPQTFSDLVGQEGVRRTLQNALKAERPSHAYLFTGSRGTGKTSTARIFAKGLNCENLKDGDPCGTCRFCLGTAEGSLVDVIEIDAASNRGIDEIRDLREKINFAPNLAKRKVYIIDEVHMMTKEAFNALLKTLEEPPDHAYFCLATTEIHKVPETIRSRCQTFSFQRFTLDQLTDRLKYIADAEKIKTDPEALNLISRKAEGGLRDAISLLEQVAAETQNNATRDLVQQSLGISDSATLQNLYQALQSGNSLEGLEVLTHLAQNGLDFRSFGHDFLGYLREQMLSQLGKPELSFTLKCIEEFEVALQRLKTSPIIELPLEIAIINLTQNTEVKPPTRDSNKRNSVQLKNNSKPALPAGGSERGVEAGGITTKTPVLQSKTTSPPQTPAPTTLAPDEAQPTPAPAKDTGFVFDGDPSPRTTTVPVPPVAPAPKIPTPPPTTGEGVDTNKLKRHMENIVAKAEMPIFAKKSFLTCTPSVEGNLITFATDSEFHREKLDQTEIKNTLTKTIKALFGVEDYQIRITKSGAQPAATPNAEKASVDDFLDF